MKFSKYNIVADTEYGLIIYNALHQCYVKIRKETGGVEHFNRLRNAEALDIEDNMVKAFYEKGYIVDDDIDEYEVAHAKINDYIKNLKTFFAQIYVTEQCNFRCTYCYEEHTDRRLSDKNWNALYKHIENGVKCGEYKNICLAFFGGEPLLELNKIEECLEKLKLFLKDYPDVRVMHRFTTNGYLLTPKVYDKLSTLDVKHYQITVDGFKEQHNKTRPRIDGEGTWDKIIKNLKYINSLNDNIFVNCRINCDMTNVDKLPKFVEWLKYTFDNPKLQISVDTVTDNNDYDGKTAEIENAKIYKNTIAELIKTPKSHGSTTQNLFKLLGLACERSFPGQYSIYASGKIAMCADYSRAKSACIGELSENGSIKFYDNYKDWSTGFEIEECKECTYYPLCGGMSCVANKVASGDGERFDCYNVKNEVAKKFIQELKDGRPDDVNKRRRMGIK